MVSTSLGHHVSTSLGHHVSTSLGHHGVHFTRSPCVHFTGHHVSTSLGHHGVHFIRLPWYPLQFISFYINLTWFSLLGHGMIDYSSTLYTDALLAVVDGVPASGMD